MVSMSVTQGTHPFCPPAVIRGSPCEYQPGEYIVDRFGCMRKICPSLSQLCQVEKSNEIHSIIDESFFLSDNSLSTGSSLSSDSLQIMCLY